MLTPRPPLPEMDDMELLLSVLEVLRHYRTRVHTPAEDQPDYLQVRTWVHQDAVAAADTLLRVARAKGYLDHYAKW